MHTARQIITKQPSERIRISMDYKNILTSGETIVSYTKSVEPTDIVVEEENINADGKSIILIVSGGVDGVTYRFEFTATTSTAQILEGDGILKVKDR